MNKYHARRTEIDGVSFDSKAEAARYLELKLLQTAGVIAALEIHPSWQLVVNGVLIGRYTADFSYYDRQAGRDVVEDVKSAPTRTRDYVLRRKLMQACHGIEVQEVGT